MNSDQFRQRNMRAWLRKLLHSISSFTLCKQSSCPPVRSSLCRDSLSHSWWCYNVSIVARSSQPCTSVLLQPWEWLQSVLKAYLKKMLEESHDSVSEYEPISKALNVPKSIVDSIMVKWKTAGPLPSYVINRLRRALVKEVSKNALASFRSAS